MRQTPARVRFTATGAVFALAEAQSPQRTLVFMQNNLGELGPFARVHTAQARRARDCQGVSCEIRRLREVFRGIDIEQHARIIGLDQR